MKFEKDVACADSVCLCGSFQDRASQCFFLLVTGIDRIDGNIHSFNQFNGDVTEILSLFAKNLLSFGV